MSAVGDAPAEPQANILLVDDEPANLLALEAVLEPLGQHLVRARSGQEALDRLAEADFAVILLNVRLPGLDGFATARVIRSHEHSRHTPIIFLTAYEGPDCTPAQAYSLGAVDYLVKPLVPEALRAKVAVFVELFQKAEETRRQRLRLEQSEERYRLLVASVKDYAIFMLDPEGHILTWDAGAEHIKGYKAEEILGRHFSVFYPPEEVARGKPERGLRTAAAVGRFEDEDWRLRKDGTRFWADVVISAVRDGTGKLVGYAKVTRDLTERRRAEEQARQLVREQIARQEAEEAVKARDRFLSIASHELRTPLNPLLLQVQLLVRAARTGSLEEKLGGKVLGILESCERQVKQFTRLVDDLLDVSRIAVGRLDLPLEEVDLAALVREVVARHGPDLAQAGCAMTLRAATPAVGRWNRLGLDRVVTNLLSNAMKYGRGKLIEVTVEAGAQAAQVIVRDHGIGIAPEDQARIFGRLERAVLGYEYGGLGMGLYIARQIVQALGGSIQVASELGAGSTFTVDLPYGHATAVGGA